MRSATTLLLLASVAVAAQPLTPGDRDFLLSQLHASRKLLLDAIDGLSPAQWTFKPAPDRWSIAECAEHVVLSEDFMFEHVRKLMQAPATPDKKSSLSNDEVMKGWVDRSRKATADAATQPKGRWRTPARLAEFFKQRRERTLEYARTTSDALRIHFDSSASGLDAYQWLLAIAGHTERHVLQINEVKADARFPR